jgi:hypothetical protein
MSPRKTGKSVPARGPGLRPKYRNLRKGEMILPTDEHFAYGEGPWLRNRSPKADSTEGQLFNPRIHHPHRRRIKTSGSESAEGRSKSKSPKTRNPQVTQGRSGRAEG